MDKLLDKATNPQQYDLDETGWESEGKGLESPTRAHFWEYLKPYVENWKGKKVLDIGSGVGWLCGELIKLGVKKAVGIEPSRKNVELAEKYYPQVETIQSTVEDFRSQERFDVVVAIMSLTHVADLAKAFSNISELMEGNGELIIVVPDFQYYKRNRQGREVNFEDIDGDQYVAMVKRPHGSIADVVRRQEVYQARGREFGFELLEDKPMPPTSQLMEKLPRYREMEGSPMTRMLRFKLSSGQE